MVETLKTARISRYSNLLIRFVLENYETLSSGAMPSEKSGYTDYGVHISISRILTAKFVRPIELVADIDRAIKSLKPTEKGIIIAMCIHNDTLGQVASWYGKEWLEVQNIEGYSIRKMKRYLNSGQLYITDRKPT
jgi:hypothetical protein